MRTSTTLRSVGGAVLLALCAAPLSAHHGWGGNNQAMAVTGTVVAALDLTGPHATLQVRDAQGQTWNVTLAPAPRTVRAGLDADAVPVGAEVTLTGMRNDDSSKLEIKTRRVTYEGRHFDVYPQ